MGQNTSRKIDAGRPETNLTLRWGALRRVNMVQNGHMASPGTVFGGLVTVSGRPLKVHVVSWDGLERSCEGLWRSSEGAWGLLARA